MHPQRHWPVFNLVAFGVLCTIEEALFLKTLVNFALGQWNQGSVNGSVSWANHGNIYSCYVCGLSSATNPTISNNYCGNLQYEE